MCRSSSPLFGAPIFRRFSRDEFERCVRQSNAFRQEGMVPAAHERRTRCLDSYETIEMDETSLTMVSCQKEWNMLLQSGT